MPGTTATMPVSSVASGSGTVVEQPLRALRRLLVHVRDLDPLDRPESRAGGERRAGVVRVDVDLQRARVADDEQRVAELLQLRLERVRVEAVALDDEDGAVAVLGQLQVDRVEAGLVRVLDRRVGQRLAGERGCDAADDLEEPGAAGVDDAGLLQHRELLRRARERVLAAGDERLKQLGVPEGRVASGLRLLRQLADHGQHRSLDRPPHGPVGGVAGADGSARLIRSVSIAPGSPSTSAAPRTICEKITPEFPRAPISAARVSSFATAARSAALDASSASTIARAVSVRFVPVSPSGTG